MPYLLQQLLTKSLAHSPDKTAVWARGGSVTYRELEEQSNQLARLLQARGIRKGDRVGLYFPKSVESVVSMLGILKAGAVYVPLDPQAPASRVAYIITNCGMRALITTRAKRGGLDLGPNPTVEFSLLVDQASAANGAVDKVGWGEVSAHANTPLGTLSVETDLAYILYTSGSTGEPKGVMISHRNALTFVDWCSATFRLRAEDRLSNHAPLHFDLSVFDIYNSLEAGATVYLLDSETVLFPASVAAFIEKHALSVWYSVPSALTSMLLHGKLDTRRLESLRLILFAGEVFPMKYLRQALEAFPQADFYNLYGPTETNVCTYCRVDRATAATLDQLPIGKACANTEAFAVDDSGQIVVPRGSGELYVRGPSVAMGYWGDAEKTRRSMLPNRFQPNFEERHYRTGDLVTVGEDGTFWFLGRRDNMVKSRGYRIELGEIESALYSHPAIKEAAVVAIPDEKVGNILKAVVVLADSASLTTSDIQRHCATRIPNYMVPDPVEFRDHLPLTSTGKVDRRKLAKEN
ncbi:MAG TPA: amino acid adenylation domain-containing protein [Terriglobia bacterium]|nr:amino acid adenylation domain-containing protein [Terriglobia bacterium]